MYEKITKEKHKLKKHKHDVSVQQEHIIGFMAQQFIIPQIRANSREQMMDAMQNPPLCKILASSNPLLSIAEYQGSVFGKHVKNTGSKMQQQERKIAVKSTRVNNLTEENKKLEETVTALSAHNETLQDAVTEAKLTTQKVEQRLCQAKSDLTKCKKNMEPQKCQTKGANERKTHITASKCIR